MFRKSILASAVLAATLGLAACGGGDDLPVVVTPTPPAAVLSNTVALTASNRLISFARTAPATITSTSPVITGLQAGETLVGIDYRPANGLLYAVGTSGAVYQLDPLTGVASNRIALTSAAAGNAPIVLTGTSFGVDFNPQADRLRVVSNTGQNLRINLVATAGNTTVDAALPATAAVSSSAYTNSFTGTSNTRLYSINLTANTLDEQGTLNPATGTTQPNDGTQTTIAPLGVTPTAVNGFDIDARNNVGYAAMTVGTSTSLYTINLSPAVGTNAATVVATIGDGTESIRGVALAPVAAPVIAALTTSNGLITVAANAPNTMITNVPAITGLNGPATSPAEQILGVDFRPQDGLLWGVSSAGRLYTIVPTTGVATFRVALTGAAATAIAASPTLTVDFNPVANRLRVITASGANFRIAAADVPATATAAAVPAGTTAVDGSINRAGGAASTVLAGAYTNSFAGATATQLFDLDGTADFLALQNPPNDGTLVNQGTLGLGVDISNFAGFDIAGGQNGLILGAVRANDTGPFLLRTINLTTGVVGVYNPVSTGTAPTDAQSQIGGAAGPAIRDIAISLQ
ncbi:MAG: DUF4394 domain-containing protein [Polaromonas sp.]